MGHKRLRPSFETPRKSAAPQDDGGMCVAIQSWWARRKSAFAHPTQLRSVEKFR
jgi:hypothetical protein